MKRTTIQQLFIFLSLTFICCHCFLFSNAQSNSSGIPFPQKKINAGLQAAYLQSQQLQHTSLNKHSLPSGVFQMLNKIQKPHFDINDFAGERSSNMDTTYVGLNVNDTLIITGNWTATGPILVFNSGVLIFQNANATILGNMYAFQNGKIFADSSTLSFPQQYFYEHMLLTADSAYLEFNNCTLDYSGLSHSLFAANTSTLMLNNTNNVDWTTAGVGGSPTVTINGTNLAGEYILSDRATFNFSHAHTLLLWHYLPDSAIVNYSFPQGDSLYAYTFDNSTPGVNGVGYSVTADSCYDVWWGLMPVNGSDVTISNSTIRAIGAWFQFADTVAVSGITNNSTYTNFTAPLADRNIHLINSSVQTWSLYTFDASSITINGCIVGEVGSQGHSNVTATSSFCDGSGGYLWATDTSLVVASLSTTTSNVRSERNGFMVFGYGAISLGNATAINNSVLIIVQSTLPQDPIPYDGSNAWLANIVPPAGTQYTNSNVTIGGSAWIDQGPLGSWLDFGKYQLFYQLTGNTTWTAINTPAFTEVHNNTLASWNTTGLSAGNYIVKLLLYDNQNDSVEAIKNIVLLPGVTGIEDISENVLQVSPNPSCDNITFTFPSQLPENISLTIFDAAGKQVEVFTMNEIPPSKKLILNVKDKKPGIYFYQYNTNGKISNGKFEVAIHE